MACPFSSVTQHPKRQLQELSYTKIHLLLMQHLNLKFLRFFFDCPNKQSDSDLTPTWLLKVCAPVLIPTITNIVNLSLTSGHFHPILKESVIFSLLVKKPTLDKDQHSNYRPISNLSQISHIQNVLSNVDLGLRHDFD